MKRAAHYLLSMKNGQPLDPVARFHLGNGARIERLNWAADTSAKGLGQSCGMMVNYLYDLDDLDAKLVQLGAGKPRVRRGIARIGWGSHARYINLGTRTAGTRRDAGLGHAVQYRT